jgi:hypothetical protein
MWGKIIFFACPDAALPDVTTPRAPTRARRANFSAPAPTLPEAEA